MSNSDWLTIERLVQILEKSIAPDSSVEHNVKLSDLSSSSNGKRQCDIVIRTGLPPRQTITIVEVQSRKSKFNLTIFQGLIKKMQDVGAQHLICVSTTGFTKTIKEKAMQLGGTVRLVLLTKNDTSTFPGFFKFTFIDCRPEYEFVSAPRVKALPSLTKTFVPITFNVNDKSFILSSMPDMQQSVKDLVSYYFSRNDTETSGVYTVKLPNPDDKLFFQNHQDRWEIKQFECDIRVTINKQEISEGNIYSYEQEEFGPIAWIIECVSTFGNTTKTIKIPVNPGPDNTFNITGIIIEQKVIIQRPE
jgi:hypothetical protein